ncbi:hypothetical protein CEUSTIGMA_g9792.t1 [Chlamydomonas eustigma]|uniref:Uncharacterized protein n=1 Tax=Chlamydomonas eustigma TaxID=1157962 RepID=A0A250XH34_9CHLO|nr:hypothetical protein CEUSTIGMA_g9792.t1 [Chlamydomonas eustigma]|eukprot:GAX82363.1 hypothetical protein CEUSTIGMA_g9792.t1 [Chlamydomonas eustigma]
MFAGKESPGLDNASPNSFLGKPTLPLSQTIPQSPVTVAVLTSRPQQTGTMSQLQVVPKIHVSRSTLYCRIRHDAVKLGESLLHDKSESLMVEVSTQVLLHGDIMPVHDNDTIQGLIDIGEKHAGKPSLEIGNLHQSPQGVISASGVKADCLPVHLWPAQMVNGPIPMVKTLLVFRISTWLRTCFKLSTCLMSLLKSC